MKSYKKPKKLNDQVFSFLCEHLCGDDYHKERELMEEIVLCSDSSLTLNQIYSKHVHKAIQSIEKISINMDQDYKNIANKNILLGKSLLELLK